MSAAESLVVNPHPGEQAAGQRPVPAYAAVVLAGGRARRFGGLDKTALVVDGLSLRDRVLAAVAGAAQIILVGPPASPGGPTAGGPATGGPTAGAAILRTREDPPGTGPVAAIAAGLDLVTVPVVVVLAGDLPFAAGLPPALLDSLANAAEAEAVVPVDDTGRLQPLAAAYRTVALARAVAELGDPAGRGMGEVVGRLAIATVDGGALPPGCLDDVDTAADLAAARATIRDYP